MSRSVPSSGNEHEPPACSNAVSAQCLSTSNENVQGLNLIKTVCSGAGFTCQQSVQGHGKACPDFKARFECPYSKGIFNILCVCYLVLITFLVKLQIRFSNKADLSKSMCDL